MSLKQIAFFMTLLLIVAIPTVYAQISIGQKAEQKLVEVVINSSNEIHVKHVISSSNMPQQLTLIDGGRTNLKVSDQEGSEKQFGSTGDDSTIMILPSQKNTIVEYDLGNVIFLKNNMMTWDFRYLETTSFIIPKEIDLIFANNRPVHLDKIHGITCHGCQMILEYSMNMPKIFENVKLDNKEFVIEVRTFAEINKFNFDQLTKSINFEVKGEKQFITTIIPQELLPGPYNVFLGDNKTAFSEYVNNGTHVWLSMRPDISGDISIISNTTTSNEKPAIEENSSTVNVDQNRIAYIILGVIVSVGIAVLIIMRKKKFAVTSTTQDNNTEKS